jgi:uncharacterized protein YggE
MMQRFLVPAALAVLTIAPCAAAAAAPTELSVTGSATVTLPPDVAYVDAAVETNAPAVGDAMSENNARYDRVVTALTRLGIARADVTLSGYNVSYNPKPHVVQPGSNEQYGYTVSRQFTVKVRKIGNAGSVVDAATAAGATGINGVSFGLADQTAARERATVAAVADARARAEALASAANLRIVALKSLDLGGAPIGPQPMVRMAAAGVAPPTQFDQANVTVTVSVSAVYLAEP